MRFHQSTEDEAAEAGNRLIRIGEIEYLTGIPFDQQHGALFKHQRYFYQNGLFHRSILLKDGQAVNSAARAATHVG